MSDTAESGARGFDALVAYERAKVEKSEAYWNGPHPFTEDPRDYSMCLCGVPALDHDTRVTSPESGVKS